ncbi:MAG: carboxyl transferase domain-containing protein, partial [Spirochaetota bacterium]
QPIPRGTAIEARLNAEDPDKDFTPAPGKVELFFIPSGPGIRVDSGIEQGSVIPQEFDSMVAKIIAFAPTRKESIGKLKRALKEMRIKIEAGTTNRSFLLELLHRPEIISGGVHTRFVEELLSQREDTRKEWHIALIACALDRYIALSREELSRFKEQLIVSGYPREISISHGYEIVLTVMDNKYRFLVKATGIDTYHLEVDGCILSVRYIQKQNESRLYWDDQRYVIQIVSRGDTLQCELGSVPYSVEIESRGFIKSPSPGLVLSIHAEPGQNVLKGETVLTLEAMKMEMMITAPEGGIIKEIRVKTGEMVSAGQLLVQMESLSGAAAKTPNLKRPRIIFRQGLNASELQWKIKKQELLALFLGYDHGDKTEGIVKSLNDMRSESPAYNNDLVTLILDVMETFAAVENFFSSRQIVVEGFARPASPQELLIFIYRRTTEREKGMPGEFLSSLERVMRWYHIKEQSEDDGYGNLLFRIYRSHSELSAKQDILHSLLFILVELTLSVQSEKKAADLLDEITLLSQVQKPSLSDAAIHARYQLIDRVYLKRLQEVKAQKIGRIIDLILMAKKLGRMYSQFMENIIDSGNHVIFDLVNIILTEPIEIKKVAMEILGRRFNRDRELVSVKTDTYIDLLYSRVVSTDIMGEHNTIVTVVDEGTFNGYVDTLIDLLAQPVSGTASASIQREKGDTEVICILLSKTETPDTDMFYNVLSKKPASADRMSLGIMTASGDIIYFTFSYDSQGKWVEEESRRFFNPLIYRELRVYRLSNFNQKLLYSSASVYLLVLTAKANPKDERLFALVEVPATRPEFDKKSAIRRMVAFEDVFNEAVYAMRAEQAKRKRRLHWNRIIIHIRTAMDTTLEQVQDYAGLIGHRASDLGLEKLVIYSRRFEPDKKSISEVELLFENISGVNFTIRGRTPSNEPLSPINFYVARVVRARQRGNIYPYEIVKMITRTGAPVNESFPKGDFEEYDIGVNAETGEHKYFSVKGRPYGQNAGNIVFGIITNYTKNHRYGIKRIIILSDTTADMGSLSEIECRRINSAFDLAESMHLPVEWLPVSAGARIDMESGTENLDWTAATLKRIIAFTQRGGEINIIVAGVNVGAQSYWNAEATMLMHTKGLLIMTEDSSMLLTGKKALDFSGSVSAEDNTGIGGVEKIMQPNGQAQIRVKNLYEAYNLLFRHYALTYVQPGKLFPERLKTSDPIDRNVALFPYTDRLGQGFACIGDIFSRELNPERKKPFEIRQVMQAVIDQDQNYLERWEGMKDAETAVVWEARIGGYAAALVGIESRSLTRLGEVPHDGPETWSGGTLFPLSSKKVARGINAFSGRLPLVILANLSGFDGSPESLRKLQLEYGAEIGRAVVNFKGAIIFIVIARYHGGAYVVFSKRLNPYLHAAALEGSYASVIGGAPAAAVVFPSLVLKETYADKRIEEAQKKLKIDPEFSQKDFDALWQTVHTEKQSELAQRFDRIHSVQRAKQVGSIDAVISIQELRPHIIKKITDDMLFL